MPAEGQDVIWDFSSGVVTDNISSEYIAADNPDFPNALNSRLRGLIFQVFAFDAYEYEGLNEDAYFVIGRTIEEATFPIGAITGGANDELKFVGGNFEYPGQQDFARFPLNYQDSWTNIYEQPLHFELTVAGFGLNAAPGVNRRYFEEHREVVGVGSFIFPDADGEASLPVPGYLIRAERTAIDSVFLGGAEAPAPLMDAFGLTQGATVTDVIYVSYTPGLGTPMLSLDGIGNQVHNLIYRPSGLAFGVDPTSVEDITLEGLSVYPNPTSGGQRLNIQAATSQQVAAVQVLALSGQRICEEFVNTDIQTGTSIVLPNHIVPGMYFVNLVDARGASLGQKKLMVR